MKLKGTIVPGVHRGLEMIEIYLPRLKHVLGFEPFIGTLDIRLEKYIDIIPFSTKKISHKLMSGKEKIIAHLCPVTLSFKDSQGNQNEYECWVIRPVTTIYQADIIEILSRESVKEKFGLRKGDEVEVTFHGEEQVKKKSFTDIFKKK